MKIDLIKDKNSWGYVSNTDNGLPFWSGKYMVKPTINYNSGVVATADISFVFGYETSNIVSDITLDIDSSSVFTNIELTYSVEDFPSDEDFTDFSWYPQLNSTEKPIYLNRTYTLFRNPIEFKCLKITFKAVELLILNNIEILKDEIINIDKATLRDFVFESFTNNILKIYKNTDIEDLAEKTITMLNEE